MTQTKYPISKIRSGEVAVKLTSIEQFKKIAPEQDLLGFKHYRYHTFQTQLGYVGLQLVWLMEGEVRRYPLIDFTQIDWDEGKEEVNKCEISPIYVSNLESEIARLKGENEKSQEAGKCIAEKLADEMKEVKRLKGENEKLESDLNRLKMEAEIVVGEHLTLKNELNKLRESPQISQYLEKRERMAWELYVSGFNHGIADKWTIAECYRSASIFINYKGGEKQLLPSDEEVAE